MSQLTNASIYLEVTPIAEQKCLISYDDISPNFYERIEIITNTPTVTKFYDLAQFTAYYLHFPARLSVDDPYRNFANLNFAVVRMQALTDATADEKADGVNINHIEVLNMYLYRWMGYDFTRGKHSLAVGLRTFDVSGLIADVDDDVASTILMNRTKGSYMIRTSRDHVANIERTAATVFTINFTLDDGQTDSITYISLHKVGIYRISNDRRGSFSWYEVYHVNYQALPDLSARTVLEAVNYRMPIRSCIIEELEHLHNLNYIRLNLIIRM